MKNAIPSAVYVLCWGDDQVKIGRSLNPAQRANNLSKSGGRLLQLVYETEVRDDASFIEAEAHRLLAAKRLYGEWFRATRTQAMDAIADAVGLVERRKAASKIVIVQLTDEEIAAIDAIIDERHGFTDRGSVIREMLNKGLKAHGAL